MGVLRGIGRGIAGTAAVAGAGAAWAGRGLGFGNTMAAGLAAGGLFKTAASNAFNGSKSANKDKGSGEKSIPLDKMSGGIPSALAEIQKEVSLIRKILETQPDPESQEQEKIIEEDARNRRLLAAISSLRLGGPGGGGKKEGFFDKLKGILGTILGMLGLASLPIVLANAAAVWDKISGAMDTLAGWLKNIDEFFENLGVQWAGAAMLGTAKAMQLRQKIVDFKNKVKDSYRRIKRAFSRFASRWSSRISRIWTGLTRRLGFITRTWNWVKGLKGRAIAGWSKFINTTWPNWKTSWLNGPWKNITDSWEKVQTKWGKILLNWANLKADWRITLAGWRQSFAMTVESIPEKITAAMKIAKTALMTAFDDWKKTNWTPISEKFATWKTTFSSWAKKIPGWEKSWFGVRAAWGVTSTAVTSAIAGIPEEWKKIKADWDKRFTDFRDSVKKLFPSKSGARPVGRLTTGSGRGAMVEKPGQRVQYRNAGLSAMRWTQMGRGSPSVMARIFKTTPKALPSAGNPSGGRSGGVSFKPSTLKFQGTPSAEVFRMAEAARSGYTYDQRLNKGRGGYRNTETGRIASTAAATSLVKKPWWHTKHPWIAKIAEVFGIQTADSAAAWLKENPSRANTMKKALEFMSRYPKIFGSLEFMAKHAPKGIGLIGVGMVGWELYKLTELWRAENKDSPMNLTPFWNDNKADENFVSGLKDMGKIYGAAFVGSIIGSAALGVMATAIGAGNPVATAIGVFAGGLLGGIGGAIIASHIMSLTEGPKYRVRPGSAGSFTAERAMQWQQQLQYTSPMAGGTKGQDLLLEIQLLDKKIAFHGPGGKGKLWSAEKIEEMKADREKFINERIKHIDALQKTGMEQIKQQDWYTPEVGKTIEEMSGMQADQTLKPALYPGHIANLTPSSVLDGAGSSENSNQTVVISYDSSSSSNNQASTIINETVYVSASGPHRGHDFYGTSGGGGW